MRVKLFGELAGARIPIQADIGFGDAVTPGPRGIEYPLHVPLGLSPEFYEDSHKTAQWNAFVHKGMLTVSPPTLKDICLSLEAFLSPPTQALVRDKEFRANWNPGGPWR